MAIAGSEYRNRVSGLKALLFTAASVGEPALRLLQQEWARSSAVKALEKFGEGSPQLNKALEKLADVSKHVAAHPSALLTVPFVFAGEIVEPDPDKNIGTLERWSRYAYLAVATRAVTIAPTILSNLIEQIKHQTDITLTPEMLWIPVAGLALLRSGKRLYDKATFANLAERREHKKQVLEASKRRLQEEMKPPNIPPSATTPAYTVDNILRTLARKFVDQVEAAHPENQILKARHTKTVDTLRKLRGLPPVGDLPDFLKPRASDVDSRLDQQKRT